jgi:hypothetical protein
LNGKESQINFIFHTKKVGDIWHAMKQHKTNFFNLKLRKCLALTAMLLLSYENLTKIWRMS